MFSETSLNPPPPPGSLLIMPLAGDLPESYRRPPIYLSGRPHQQCLWLSWSFDIAIRAGGC